MYYMLYIIQHMLDYTLQLCRCWGSGYGSGNGSGNGGSGYGSGNGGSGYGSGGNSPTTGGPGGNPTPGPNQSLVIVTSFNNITDRKTLEYFSLKKINIINNKISQ